jgi:hypothetical protein
VNTPNGMHFSVNKNTVFVDSNYKDNTWNHVLWNIKDKNNKGFVRINNGIKNEYDFTDKFTMTNEYPRDPLTSNVMIYKDSSNIQVRVTASSGTSDAYKLFDNIFYKDSNGWSSDSGKYTSGFATNSTSFFNNDTGYFGEWIMIDLGESVILEKYRIYPYNFDLERTPRDFRIYATNDTDSWNNTKSGRWIILDEENNISDYANDSYKEFSIFITEKYRFYALLINKTQFDNDTTMVQFSELVLFGRSEYNLSNTVYSFVNKISNYMNQGAVYISDFMIITKSLDYEYENTLYNTVLSNSKVLNVDTLNNNLMNINSLYFNSEKRLDTINTGAIVYGNVTVTGNTISNYSDMRLKEVISGIEEPIDKVMKLNTYKYTWNERAHSLLPNNHSISENVEIGLSAQEVNEVLPEVVDLAPIDREYLENGNVVSKTGANYLTLSYEGLVPLLLESIKVLKQKISYLTSKKST